MVYRESYWYEKVLQSEMTSGLIPSPVDSSPDAYCERVKRVQELLNINMGICEKSRAQLDPYREEAESLFHSKLSYVPIQITSDGLNFWEPACCWIEEHTVPEEPDKKRPFQNFYTPLVQFHPSLLSQTRSKWLLSPRAIILHEYVHAIRVPLEASRYEEYIAYTVSQKVSKTIRDRIRSYIGPLFHSSQEIYAYFSLYLIALIYFMFWAPPNERIGYFEVFTYQVVIAACLLIPFVFRLIRNWKKIRYVYETICKNFQNSEMALSLFIRLSDSDVEKILQGKAKWNIEEASDWRWKYYLYKYVLCKTKELDTF